MTDKSNGLGVAGLVLGITSIIFCWVPFMGLPASIIGTICSSKQKKKNSNGMATAGLVTSIIGIVFSAIYFLFWVILASFVASI